MKVLIALVLCSIAVLVATENCFSVRQCDHVDCDSGHDLDCHRGHCTCSDSTQPACKAKTDCSGTCRHNDWHCVDLKCRCGYGITFPGTGGK